MQKTVRILFLFIATLFLFAGCTKKQPPTPSSAGITGPSTSDAPRDYEGDFVPNSNMEGFGLGAEGLVLRDETDGISNGMYNGREMVEGVLPSVFFGFDSSSIAPSERGKLQQAADYLLANPSMGLLIEGHCDWYGTAEYNLALGDRRAESITNYLGTLGISPMRVDKLSKGSLEATTGLSKEESSKDRRADLILLK